MELSERKEYRSIADQVDRHAPSTPSDDDRRAACVSLVEALPKRLRILAAPRGEFADSRWVIPVLAGAPTPPGYDELYPAGRILGEEHGWTLSVWCYHADARSEHLHSVLPGFVHRGVAFGVSIVEADDGDGMAVYVDDPLTKEGWTVLDVDDAPIIEPGAGVDLDALPQDLAPYILPPVSQLIGQGVPAVQAPRQKINRAPSDKEIAEAVESLAPHLETAVRVLVAPHSTGWDSGDAFSCVIAAGIPVVRGFREVFPARWAVDELGVSLLAEAWREGESAAELLDRPGIAHRGVIFALRPVAVESDRASFTLYVSRPNGLEDIPILLDSTDLRFYEGRTEDPTLEAQTYYCNRGLPTVRELLTW